MWDAHARQFARGETNGPDFERLAKDSRNNVRDCLMRLEVELLAL
jgi:hypothetical protein